MQRETAKKKKKRNKSSKGIVKMKYSRIERRTNQKTEHRKALYAHLSYRQNDMLQPQPQALAHEQEYERTQTTSEWFVCTPRDRAFSNAFFGWAIM